MDDLVQQAKVQIVDLAATWQGSSVHQKQELAAVFFPEGLRWDMNGATLNRVTPLLLRCFTDFWKTRVTMERETGFEPATSTLARSHSTTELLPPDRLDYKQAVTSRQWRARI
jgi:hypothetical protein